MKEVCGTCKFMTHGHCHANPPTVVRFHVRGDGDYDDAFSFRPEVDIDDTACRLWTPDPDLSTEDDDE